MAAKEKKEKKGSTVAAKEEGKDEFDEMADERKTFSDKKKGTAKVI